MSPVQVYAWDGVDSWDRHGFPSFVVGPPDTDFELGVTMPVWKGVGDVDNNVGVPSSASLSPYAGTINFSNGPVNIVDQIVTARQTMVGSGHRFTNCRFTSTYTGDSGGGQVMSLDPSVSGAVFNRCEFIPSATNDRFAGIYGHDYTLNRCVIQHTCDSIDVYNHQGGGGRADVYIYGCWVGWMSWYNDDGYPARPNSHSDGVHDDGIQQAGAPGVTAIGNFWQGARFNALNPGNVTLDSDGLEFVYTGGGTTPLDGSSQNRHPQSHTIWLAQMSIGLPGVDAEFHQNWVWNGDQGFSLVSNASYLGSGQYRFVTANATGNRFGGVWRDYGTNNFYPFRLDTNAIFNGRSMLGKAANGAIAVSLPNNDSHPEDGNIWLGTSYLGTDQPVAYRIDGKPVAQA